MQESASCAPMMGKIPSQAGLKKILPLLLLPILNLLGLWLNHKTWQGLKAEPLGLGIDGYVILLAIGSLVVLTGNCGAAYAAIQNRQNIRRQTERGEDSEDTHPQPIEEEAEGLLFCSILMLLVSTGTFCLTLP